MMANGADPFTASNHSKSTYFGFILTSTWVAWTGCGRRGSAVHWVDARFLNGDVEFFLFSLRSDAWVPATISFFETSLRPSVLDVNES